MKFWITHIRKCKTSNQYNSTWPTSKGYVHFFIAAVLEVIRNFGEASEGTSPQFRKRTHIASLQLSRNSFATLSQTCRSNFATYHYKSAKTPQHFRNSRYDFESILQNKAQHFRNNLLQLHALRMKVSNAYYHVLIKSLHNILLSFPFALTCGAAKTC